MQKIGLLFKGAGSLTINVAGYPSIHLLSNKEFVFNSANEYKPYSVTALNWKNAGQLDIREFEGKVAPVKAAEVASPAPEVKEEPKAEATAEIKIEEPKAETPVAPRRGRGSRAPQ